MTAGGSANNRKRFRLAVLMSHPIQYHVELMRRLASHPYIKLTAYYMNDLGLREAYIPGYGVALKWDIPLLNSYPYRFLRNWSFFPDKGVSWSSINPGIMLELKKERYDALMLYGYIRLTDIMALIAARLTRTPVLFRGDVLLKGPGHGLKLRLREYYLRLWCRGISVALPVGSLAEQFYIHYGLRRERIVFAPYAVNNEFFIQECAKWRPEKTNLKKAIGITGDPPVILYVALMRPFKRPFDVVYATEQLSDDSAALVMVGGGPEYPRLQAYCKQRKIRNIFLLGPKNQEELPKYYAMADIFVMPSGVGETWGLVINEAMCCGLPVLASNAIPSALDLVKHGENGFIYPAGNVGQLAGFLETLISNPILRKKMGLRSREVISEWNYDSDVAAILHSLEIVAKRCQMRNRL